MARWYTDSSALILVVAFVIFEYSQGQTLPPSTDPPFNAPLEWDKQQIAEKYPDPKTQFHYCKQNSPSSFCDPNYMIRGTNDIRKDLTDVKVPEIYCEASNHAVFGIPFAVAVISKAKFISPDTLDVVMQTFASIIYSRWDVLSSDNGILLFVSCNDSKIYVKFGDNTVRSVLPNYRDKIGQPGLVSFTGSDCYKDGILPKLELYRDVAAGSKEYFCEAVVSEKDYTVLKTKYNGVVAGLIIFAIAFIIVAVIFALYWRKSHNEQKPKESNPQEGISLNSPLPTGNRPTNEYANA